MSTLDSNVNNLRQRYLEMVVRFSKRMNLVSRRNVDNIVERLYAESLLPLRWKACRLESPVIDFGTGAGFPGIPLKLENRQLKVDLVEANYKKCLFLEMVIRELQIDNIKVLNQRIENLASDETFRADYATVVSRGVGGLEMLSKAAARLLKPGGEFILWKGLRLKDELPDVDLSGWSEPGFWRQPSGLTLLRLELATRG